MDTLTDLLQKDIFTILGLEHLPEDKKAELFQQAYETVMNRVLLRVADQLEPEQLDEMKALFSQQKSQEAAAMLSKIGIDVDQIATHEALAYKAEMADLTAAIKEQQYAS